MLLTAKNHFDQDIARAKELHTHAKSVTQTSVAEDVLRAAWMMAVGACDAYFSDAYADLISRALRAKELQPAATLPDRLNNLRVPVNAILREANGGWRWRMAARELVETENVLSLDKIKTLFNHFFRTTHKLFSVGSIEPWILHSQAKVRLFGVTQTEYRKTAIPNKASVRANAIEKLGMRYGEIFQRRHDCIHNCDRPKVALQGIAAIHVEKVIDDIEFLICRCHDALVAEFPQYLKDNGFDSTTRNQVCMP